MRAGIGIIASLAALLSILFFLYQPRIIVVASSSMEPSLLPGDAVLVVGVRPEDVRVGDVISYIKAIPFMSTQTVTHRVVGITSHDGVYVFKTKGDSSPEPDPWDVTSREVIGKAVFHIPKLGYALQFVKANLAAIVLITVGLGLILLHQAYREGKAEENIQDKSLQESTPSLKSLRNESVAGDLEVLSMGLLRLEVVSRSDMMVCLECGASAPIGAEKCLKCGGRFKRADLGLRCPVCGGPFSAAKNVSAGHYVCGQCFSDIRVQETERQMIHNRRINVRHDPPFKILKNRPLENCRIKPK